MDVIDTVLDWFAGRFLLPIVEFLFLDWHSGKFEPINWYWQRLMLKFFVNYCFVSCAHFHRYIYIHMSIFYWQNICSLLQPFVYDLLHLLSFHALISVELKQILIFDTLFSCIDLIDDLWFVRSFIYYMNFKNVPSFFFSIILGR